MSIREDVLRRVREARKEGRVLEGGFGAAIYIYKYHSHKAP